MISAVIYTDDEGYVGEANFEALPREGETVMLKGRRFVVRLVEHWGRMHPFSEEDASTCTRICLTQNDEQASPFR